MSLYVKTSVLVAATVLMIVAGCGDKKESNQDSGPASNGSSTVQDRGSFDSPTEAVQTFVKAAVAQDVDLLAKCVHANCSGEFKPLREKTTEPEMLDELAELFTGAEVGDSEIDGDNAVVQVKLTSREEELSMSKSDSGWQLVDF